MSEVYWNLRHGRPTNPCFWKARAMIGMKRTMEYDFSDKSVIEIV